MKFTVSMYVAILLAVNTANSLECHKNADGSFEFHEDGEVVVPKPFDCLSVTKLDKVDVVTFLSDDDEGRKICQIHSPGKIDKTIYTRSEVESGTQCKYTCKDASGLFKCDSSTTATENACTCKPRQHAVLIRPVAHTEIGGQSEQGEQDDSCHGMPEGYKFHDPVPCISLRAEVTKRRVDFIDSKLGGCMVETKPKPETRYIRASPDDLNLQGCYSVCKMAGPQCTFEEVHGLCDCASPGLTKRLVAMGDESVRDVIRQTSCALNGCGPCGTCNEETEQCVLHPNAHMGDFCPCGEICPESDLRSPKHLGGKLLCISNHGLECMERPGWLKSLFDHSRPGSRHPNLCTSGKSDNSDTCSCAPGYAEILGKFSKMYCSSRKHKKKDKKH